MDSTQRAEGRPTTLKMLATEAKIGRILDAAVDVFSRVGFEGGRIETIASNANVTKTNLLYYFRTKEVLYRAALQRVLDLWLVPLREFDPDRDPIEALTDYVTRKLEYSHTRPAASRLFAMEMLQGAPLLRDVLEGPLYDVLTAKCAVIEGWIASGKLAPVNPRHLIFSIWALTQHYADFAAQIEALTGKTLDNPRFRNEVREAVLAILLNGVAPREKAARPRPAALPPGRARPRKAIRSPADRR
jgi:TetR/AcrR family transcriptional regulator